MKSLAISLALIPLTLAPFSSVAQPFERLPSVPGIGTSQVEYVGAETIPDRQLEQALVRMGYETLTDTDFPSVYSYHKIDLNGDRQPEVVVLVQSFAVCGTGGCPFFILQGKNNTYTSREGRKFGYDKGTSIQIRKKEVPRLAPKPLSLKETQREELQKLVHRHSTPQQIAQRARIILLADEGNNHTIIAQSLNISRDMARLWRNRWLELEPKDIPVEERLQDAQRPGSPMTFSLKQILQLFAMACEPPENYQRPITHWTPRELADELVKQGIVKSISARHVGRLLEEATLKPHQSSYWLNPPPTQNWKKKLKEFVKFTSMPNSEQQ